MPALLPLLFLGTIVGPNNPDSSQTKKKQNKKKPFKIFQTLKYHLSNSQFERKEKKIKTNQSSILITPAVTVERNLKTG